MFITKINYYYDDPCMYIITNPSLFCVFAGDIG